MSLQTFKECYLHIGPPKTGTTSIQQTLWKNRDALAAAGIHYPSLEANHRFFVSAFHQEPEQFDYNRMNNLAGPRLRRVNARKMREFEKEASESGCKTLVISAEHLQLLDREAIGKVRTYLQGIAEKTYIVCYIRHPVLAASSYAQEAIKNGARRLADVQEHPPYYRFGNKLREWVEAFGRDWVVLRVLSRDLLYRGDLIQDFLNVLSYSGPEFPTAVREREGLSAAGVLIADSLADFAPKFSKNRAPHGYLQRIEGKPFRLKREALLKVQEQCKTDLEYLEKEFGVVLPDPEIEAPPGDPFDAEAILSIAKLLNNFALTRPVTDE
jgi:hypothetical protein